jgi:hypothetical protein
MTKPKQQTFAVNFRISLDIGFEIKAESFQDAVTYAQGMTVSDIVDFTANGWDHNDSDKPILKGVFVV